MNYTLHIKCETAVSPSSGESWGSYVDNDIVYDELGLPYIPARRIKGILLESAVDVVKAIDGKSEFNFSLKSSHIESLFGKPGKEESCPLKIDNAYLKDYENVYAWMSWAKSTAPEYATQQQVLSLFTTTRTQTAISSGSDPKNTPNGVALDHSLRVHRILNRGCEFISDIEIADEYKNLAMLLALSAQVSCSLGLSRNRGLGVISMALFDNDGNNVFEKLPLSIKESEGQHEE